RSLLDMRCVANQSPPYRRRHHWVSRLIRMARAYRCAPRGATTAAREPPGPKLLGRDQASAKITVTVTVTCCRPGETGTGDGVAVARASPGASSGSGTAGPCSDTLTTGPADMPSAFAYWAALVLASVTARARAAASRGPVSLRLSDTPSTSVASPPARAA